MQSNTLIEGLLYIKYALLSALHPSTFKVMGAALLIVYSFLFDPAHTQTLIALLALIILDFVTGITASKVNGDPIRSSKIRHSALKVFAYFGTIAGANLAEAGLISYLAVIDETVIAFFAITELLSLLENVSKMGFQTPKKILNQLQDIKKNL